MVLEHVMLDFETLDTVASAAIISIGAVKFDPNSDLIDDNGFYASVSIESNLALGRTISENTLLWWMQQPKEAQAVFFEPKQTLESAFDSLTEWFQAAPQGRHIWSNGADFDIAMASHAYRQLGWEPPWKFWDSWCVRTYKKLPGAKSVSVTNLAKHNALSDAVSQARLVQAIQKKLNAGHPMVKAAL